MFKKAAKEQQDEQDKLPFWVVRSLFHE